MFNHKYGLNEAVLDRRKTKTRRGITYPRKYKGTNVAGFHVYTNVESGKVTEVCMYDEDERNIDEGQLSPRYKVGEVVAIAQSYKEIGLDPNTIVGTKKDGTPMTAIESKGWTNKMFVKAEFMPHQIRITEEYAQKLQDISDEDCLAEGIIKKWHVPAVRYFYYLPNVEVKTKDDVYLTSREAFAVLIDKTSRKGIWESNPFVWAYEFELVK